MQNLYISKYPNCANVRRICQQNGYLFRKILTFDGRENNVFHDGGGGFGSDNNNMDSQASITPWGQSEFRFSQSLWVLVFRELIGWGVGGGGGMGCGLLSWDGVGLWLPVKARPRQVWGVRTWLRGEREEGRAQSEEAGMRRGAWPVQAWLGCG